MLCFNMQSIFIQVVSNDISCKTSTMVDMSVDTLCVCVCEGVSMDIPSTVEALQWKSFNR